MDIEKSLELSGEEKKWGVLRLHKYEDGTSSNRVFEHLTGRLIADNVYGPDAAFIVDARENFPESLRRLKAIADLLNMHGVWEHELQPDADGNEVDRAIFVSLIGEHAETLRSLLSLDGKDGA